MINDGHSQREVVLLAGCSLFPPSLPPSLPPSPPPSLPPSLQFPEVNASGGHTMPT